MKKPKSCLVMSNSESHAISALEWQAIAKERVTPAIAEEVHHLGEDIPEALRALELAGKKGIQAVEKLFLAYISAMNEELLLLDAGRVKEAEQVDEEKVDPSFEKVTEEINRQAIVFAAEADRARALAEVGSVVSFLAAALLAGGMLTTLT